MSARSTPAAATADAASSPRRVVVGGVGQLWQGDLDLGRRAVEELAGEDLGPGVAVEDLCYGAVQVSWRLEDLMPQALIVVGAHARGRAPGTVQRRVVEPFEVAPDEARHAVDEALTGYLSIDLLVEVLAAFGVLPAETVVIDVEPQTRYPSCDLSPVCAEALGAALALIRTELRRLAAPVP